MSAASAGSICATGSMTSETLVSSISPSGNGIPGPGGGSLGAALTGVGSLTSVIQVDGKLDAALATLGGGVPLAGGGLLICSGQFGPSLRRGGTAPHGGSLNCTGGSGSGAALPLSQ